jgi:hypothetical protein
MTENKSNNGLKVLAGLLGVVLVGTLIWTISLYQDKKETTAKLTEEKQLVVEDLNSLKSEYDKAIEENNDTNQELVEARDRIAQYIDSVKTMKADISALWKYRRQVNILKKEREVLMAQNDSLRSSNSLLAMQRDSTMTLLEEQTTYNDSLLVQNTELAKVVELGAALSLSKFNVDAVLERSSGKLVSTSRARRADKFKVCFTVADNKISTSGDRQFFIEVLDPYGRTLGENTTVSNDDGMEVNYSKATNFFFENKALDVCDYINKPTDNFSKGNYTVNVYSDDLQLLGSSKFTLK